VFATLLGGLPRPPVDTGSQQTDPPTDAIDADVTTAIRAQEDAGLEPITDGRLRDPDFERLARALGSHAGLTDGPLTGEPQAGEPPTVEPQASASIVEGWRAAAALTDRAVKQALPGPYTLARRLETTPGERDKRTQAMAEALAELVTALAAAGCPLVEIEEAEAHLIGDDERERRLFREAHRRLTEGAARGSETHLSLSIVGGSAVDAGVETILDAPYASLAVDLIAGPDNWHLVTRAPGGRGVIAGVQAGRESVDEPREVMLWAAHYAASSGRRGPVRVGLGSAGSYANLTWAAAVRKMGLLGEAARLAALPPSEELARSLDPRSVSSRRAALGHGVPKPKRRR
jgi:methionine synthase II (cobalamin-independent)